MLAEEIETKTTPEEEATLVFLRAAEGLGLKGGGLARATGISEATISRMRTGPALLTIGTKPHEFTLMLIRIHRALMKIFDGDEEQVQGWMHTHQKELKGIPAELIGDIRGMVSLLIYSEIRASSM